MDDLVKRLRDAECESGCGSMEVCVCAYALDAADRIEELEAERDEALRRRDEWRKRAEGHVEIVNALKAKTAGKDSRTLGRALLGAAFTQCEAELAVEKARAERAEAMLKEAVEALRPFAQMPIRNGVEVVCDVTPQHVHRARALLARIAQEGKE